MNIFYSNIQIKKKAPKKGCGLKKKVIYYICLQNLGECFGNYLNAT